MRLGENYPLLTRLSAAVYSGDIDYARELFDRSLFAGYGAGEINSILRGKRLAVPDPSLPPDEDPFAGLNGGWQGEGVRD